VIEFCALFFEKSVLARFAGIGGFLTAIAAHSTLGAIFGLIKAKPFWAGPFLPIYFILSALVSGTAFLIFMTIATYRVQRRSIPTEIEELIVEMGKKLLVLFLGIVIFFWIWKVISSLYGHPPGKYEAMMSLIAGPLSLRFWLFEILIGLLIPFFFLLFFPKAKSSKGVFLASLLVLIGLFVSRFDLVITGQITPVWGGPYASYSPTLIEWIMVASAIALCLLLYSIGVKLLPLEEKIQTEGAKEKAEDNTEDAS
jgi:molybdopterin-containing oxidoreductase family membrane subunit